MTRDAFVYGRAAALGGAIALVVELALLLSGGPFFGYEPLGDVFDAQARSFLQGRWDIPPDVIKIEGFIVDGRTYTYFGPVPALLRLPIVAFTDAWDGRLTRLSLLVAWAVTIAFAVRISWRARRAVAGDAPVGRFEQVMIGLFALAIGAGSSVTYLASRPSVFHEAIAWGVALALVGVDAILAWTERRTWLRFVLAIAAATAALLARASVGSAPAAALGFVLLGDLVRSVRRREVAAAGKTVALGLVLLLPLAAYAGVNSARFGSPFTLPWDRHFVSIVVEHRRNVLQANHGTIQGPQFVPTTALHYIRPDALGIDGVYPWIDFPPPATVINGVLLDQIDAASSVPSSMPALTVLAAIGVVAAVVDRRFQRFRPVLAGAAACIAVTLTIGFVAQRYTADAVPLLTIAGAVALPVLAARRPLHRAVLVATAALVVVSTAITAALTIQFQQHYGFLTPPHLREALARRQLDLPAAERPEVLRADQSLPDPAGRNRTFVIVGDCDGLYRSDGLAWQVLEGTAATGHFRVRVRPTEEPVEIVAGITVRRDGGDVVVERGEAATRPIAVGAGDALVLDVAADHLLGFVDVRHDDEFVLSDFYFDPRPGEAVVESDAVDVLPSPTPVCDELAGRSS